MKWRGTPRPSALTSTPHTKTTHNNNLGVGVFLLRHLLSKGAATVTALCRSLPVAVSQFDTQTAEHVTDLQTARVVQQRKVQRREKQRKTRKNDEKTKINTEKQRKTMKTKKTCLFFSNQEMKKFLSMIKQNWKSQAPHDACVPGFSDNLSGGRCWAVVSNTTTSFQQGESQSTTARQNRSPPEQPSQPGAGAKRWLSVACFRLCSLAREALSFRRPPSSRFASQNHESGSPMATSQFGVNSFLASSGAHQSSPIDVDAARFGVCHLFSMARPLSCPRQVGLHGIKEARRRRLPDDDHPHALEAPSQCPSP